MAEHGQRPKVGLVLTGGGARAAYQVGVLRAIAEFLPAGVRNPFPIICGTSAGAVNAAVLAANSSDFRRGVQQLSHVWENFHARQVYRADPLGALGNSARWVTAVLTGGLAGHAAMSLLDNAPLRRLIRSRVDFAGIQPGIDRGDLTALAITASGYTSGESVTFYQGSPSLNPWRRARRVGFATAIGPEHLLASSALPFIFPAVRIHREYFGDGSMRQIAPVSPALHLGAERLFIIGVGRQLTHRPERMRTDAYPTLAQIAGHCLNSIFLDSLEVDLERLQRINRTVSLMPPELQANNPVRLHPVDFRLIAASEEVEKIAVRHMRDLPRTIRLLLAFLGALRASGSNLVSYLLFEQAYCQALTALGYHDTVAHRDDLVKFLALEG